MSITLDHWLEWKKVCSVAGCCHETQRELADMLTGSAVKYAAGAWYGDYNPREYPGDLIFDAHVSLAQAKGKPVKDWMIQRCELEANGNPDKLLSAMGVNAAMLLRTAVRNLGRNESHEKMIAPSVKVGYLDAKVSPDSHTTYGDLIEGTLIEGEDIDLATYQDLGQELAASIIEDLDWTEKVVVAALGSGLALSSSAVEFAAGRKKSVLTARKTEVGERISAVIREKYPEEDDGPRSFLMTHVLAELAAMCLAAVSVDPRGQTLTQAAQAASQRDEEKD